MHCKLLRMKYRENFHHEYQSSATIMKPLKHQFSLDSIATYDKGVAFHPCVLEKHSKLQITFERRTILLLAWSWVKLPFKKKK